MSKHGSQADNSAVGAGAGGSGDPVVNRRTFLRTLAGGMLASPLAAQGQSQRTWRIGWLSAGVPTEAKPRDLGGKSGLR